MRLRDSARARHRIVAALAAAAALAGAWGSALAGEPSATVVEFHDALRNRYFITASPAEAAALDAGAPLAGWTRTGIEWKAWTAATDAAGSVPVCRFRGTPGRGPDSPFYTAVGSSRVDLQACKLEYSIVSPK